MISVKVKAMMDLANAMGCYEQVLMLPEGSTLSDLLDALEEKYGKAVSQILHRNQKSTSNHSLIFMVNGRNVDFLDGIRTTLNDNDEIFFLSPAGGG